MKDQLTTDLDTRHEARKAALELPLRSRQLLKQLIERYLREGQPVGSNTLAKEMNFPLSSATIRNIMVELEERGLVTSPHTSAGRIPTELGLRFFVDQLLTIQPLDSLEISIVREELATESNTDSLINSASHLLSQITQLVGVVSTPRHEQQLLRFVEFLPLSQQRMLVILVVNEQIVQNRIIHTQKEYSKSELEQAASFLSSNFAGKDLMEIRRSLVKLLQDEREHLDQLMRTAIEIADKAFDVNTTKNDYILAGETNLLALGEPLFSHQIRKIFEAFTQKQEILQLLELCIKASNVQIFIGDEMGEPSFKGYSVVTAPYSIQGQVLGALGVIGPTRMAYDRVIPVVDMTAKLLSTALNSQDKGPM